MVNNASISDYFVELGFSEEVASIYQALLKHGPQTISELARSSDVPRIRIYRLLEKLKTSSLIEIELKYKRTIIRAAPLDNLELLILKREQQLADLKARLPMVQSELGRQTLSSPATHINFYSGPEGIRQMLWAQLRAKGEIVGYNYSAFEDILGVRFITEWAHEFEQRNLRCRLVYGDYFLSTLKLGRRIKGMEYHYLSSEVFQITHSCDVFDDITAYYHWKDGEIFGLEMHNQEIADSQRQLFEILFRSSVPETTF